MKRVILAGVSMLAAAAWIAPGAGAAVVKHVQPKPAGTPAVQAKAQAMPTAKAVFAAAAAHLAAAKSVTYTAGLTYMTGPQTSLNFQIDATMQRPTQLHAVISSKGVPVTTVDVGPDKGYVVDAATKKYAAFDTRSTYDKELDTARVNSYQIIDPAALYSILKATHVLTKANFDLSGDIDPSSYSASVVSDTLHEHPVYRVIQRLGAGTDSMRVDTYINRQTYLPEALSQTVNHGGKSITVFKLNFTSIAASDDLAADQTQFSWTPAADNVAYAAPAEDDGEQPLLADGIAAPDFTVQTADGHNVKLSDFAGKVVVIDFWATWCGPCQKSLPDTDKLAAKYANQPIVFLPICTWDTKDKFDPWVKARSNWTMAFCFDPAAKENDKSIAGSQYAVTGIPTQYIVGKDGKVFTGFVGYDPDTTDLTQSIDRALAGS